MARPQKYKLTEHQEQAISLLYRETLLTVGDIVFVLGFPFRLVNDYVVKTFNVYYRKERKRKLQFATGYYKSVPVPPQFSVYYPGNCMSEHVLVYLRETNLPYLPNGYCIHHKNGVRDDNRFENLQLVTAAEHGKLHHEMRRQFIADSVCPFWQQVNLARLEKILVQKSPEQEAKDLETIKNSIRAAQAVWKESHYRKG